MESKKVLVFDLDDTIFSRLPDNFSEDDLRTLSPFRTVYSLLLNENFIKVLVTKGDLFLQSKKINNLGIKDLFESIFVVKENEGKKFCFQKIISQFPKNKIFVIGDRIDSEIRYGNELGLTTIRLKQGKYKDLKASSEFEKPNYEIEEFSQLFEVLKI